MDFDSFPNHIKQEPCVEFESDYSTTYPDAEVKYENQIDGNIEDQSSTIDQPPTEALEQNHFDCSVCLLSFMSLQEKCLHFNKVHPILNVFRSHSKATNVIESSINQKKHGNNKSPHLLNTLIGSDWKELRDHLFLEEGKGQTKNSENTTFSCDHCGLHYVRKADLRRHILKHITPTEANRKQKVVPKLYTCEHCDMKFVIKQSWRRHIQMHEMPNCFQCEHCEKSFYRSDTLKEHLRTHTGERPYDCLICHTHWTSKKSLQMHIRTHPEREIQLKYPIRKTQKTIELYTCEYCGQQFNRKYHWRRHTDQHEKPRSHSCDICGRKFHRPEHLKTHRLSHIGTDI